MGLLLALVATVALGALGGGLVTLTSTEALVATNFRDAADTLYAAEAGADHLVRELQGPAAWTDWLTGATASALDDGTLAPTLPSNRVVSLVSLSADLQAESDAAAAWGANDPRWRLVAHGPVSALAPAGRPASGYVIVWLADDPAESDGDPWRDTNGIVLVRARALGRGAASRSVNLVVANNVAGGAGASAVRVLSWRVVQ
jgi:hypothetical protein